MQVVTKIAQQKRNKQRFNVFINDAYAFSVSEEIYAKYQLYKGKILTEEQIDLLKKEDNVHKHYLLAINYLSYRMRTEQEMRNYLHKKEVHLTLIDQIVTQLYENKLLDDFVFATTFVKDRSERTTKGPLLIQSELLEKGVAKDTIAQALTFYPPEKQIENAYQWVTKEAGKKSKHSFLKRKEQLLTKLIRRGFSQAIAKEALARLNIHKDEDREWQILKKEAEKLYTKYKQKYTAYELDMQLKQRLYRRGFSWEMIERYMSEQNND